MKNKKTNQTATKTPDLHKLPENELRMITNIILQIKEKPEKETQMTQRGYIHAPHVST